jgi:DNA-binding PadR family transcriptional regulator
MSGYDIKKTVEQSISNFWHESYGQIYPILKRLAAEGLTATSVEKQVGKPDRYVYALTEKGRKALQAWLRKPVLQEVGRIEILLKLFFGRQVAVADNIRHIQRFRTRQRQQLKKLDAIEAWLRTEHADHPDLPYWLMTISHGRHCSEALLRWCDETLTTLRSPAAQAQTMPSQPLRVPMTRSVKQAQHSTPRSRR